MPQANGFPFCLWQHRHDAEYVVTVMVKWNM